MHGELTDARIRQLADECRRRERFVTTKLDPEVAIKSMSKFRKELLTRIIVANFCSRDELRAAMIADIRRAWGLSDFYCPRRGPLHQQLQRNNKQNRLNCTFFFGFPDSRAGRFGL